MKLNNKETEKQAQRNKEGEENTSALSSKEKITRLASTRVKRPGSQSISEIKTRDRVNPYESDALNWKYKQTVAALYNIQQKSGYKGNLFDDAKEATDYYAQTVYDSHRLFGGNRGKDYLSIAEKSFQEKLQDLVYKYQYGAQTEEQLKQSLLDTEYQGPKQIAAQNQQNVIDRAAQMGAGKLPDEQQRLIDSFSRLPEIAGKASMYGGLSLNPDEAATWQYAMRQPGNEWMAEANWADPLTQERMRKWAAAEAQKIRGGYVLDYDTADEYMQGVPGYAFAREHQGDLTPYAEAFSRAGNIVKKVKNYGVDSLNDTEKEVYYDMQGNNGPEMGAGLLGMGDYTEQEIQSYNDWGRQQAEALLNMNGIFTTYTPSREQQAILDLYRQTPEGARDYLDEATGTKEEQKAKDNFFFVTERDKFNAYEQREDFNPNTPINEKFMNDPVYAAVSGRPSSSLLGTLGQTTFQAFTDVNYMTPEEKGKYRWYYENVNPKTAQEYYHLLSYELAERREALQEAGTKATVKSDPGNALAMEAFSFLENIPGGIFGTADLYGQMLKQETGELNGPVNYHSPWQGLNNQAETIRTETTAEIQEAMKNAGASDWLIQTVTMLKNGFEGAGDSLLSAYVGGFFGGTETGAKLLTNLIVSSRSALESMQSIHDRNGSDEQAAIGGIASGVAEWFFEQFSIEQLFSDAKRIGKQGFSDWVKSMLKEMGVNAQQEGFTSIADSITDVLLMGDASEYALSRDEYERLDMSPEDAEARAKQDLAEKAGQEALGGLIMGGIVGAGTSVTSAINTAAEERATGEQILEKGWGEALKNAAEEYGIKSKAAQKLAALNKENAHAGKFARAAGEVYRDWVSRQSGNTQESREALDLANDMLTKDFKEEEKNGQEAPEAEQEAPEAVTGTVPQAPAIAQQAAEEGSEPEEGAELEERAETKAEELPEFGMTQARQMGFSGRRQEDFEETVRALGMEVTPELQKSFDQGRAEYAYQETKRMEKIAQWNGKGGKGVVRSIRPEEAAQAGVGVVSDEYIGAESDTITALRGLAETTGVNMVLFESPVKEGTHVGDNGWYDPKTRTVYLDIYSGKDNEKALLRTASHELTHFIKDWSPVNFRKYRDFLLEYFYSNDKDAVKKLIQEQKEKDGTLTDAEAMEEVIADASEMMLNGEDNPEKAESAVKTLSEQRPRLFVRIKAWIDKWAQALTRAWRNVLPSNMASRMLKESAQTFRDAQRMWWDALEDASINHRGEIREAEIENEQQAQIEQVRQEQQQAEDKAEKARQDALERAGEAQTVEEVEQAIREAQAAEAAREEAAAKAREEEQRIAKKAEQKKREAEKITRQGNANEKRLGRMTDGAREHVRQFAADNGFALDGTAKAGDDLLKEALHYFNQGKAGMDFNPNTPGGQGPFVHFFEEMNQYGQEEKNRAALEEMAQAEPEETVNTEAEEGAEEKTPEQVAEEVVRNGFDDDRLFNREAIENMTEGEAQQITDMFSRENTEEMAQESQAAAKENDLADRMKAIVDKVRRGEIDEIEGIAEARAEANKEFRNRGGKATDEGDTETLEHNFFMRENFNPIRREIISENQEYERQKATDNTPTTQETQAMETHAQTVMKIGDVLQGMTKAARNLVMKWAANEQLNLKMEDGNEKAVQFAQFAKKWYDAGREGLPRASLVEPTLRNLDGTTAVRPGVREDEADAEWPPFLQDDFYNKGKADAEAEAKKQKKKEAKKDEKPADKGAGERAGNAGDGAERLLAAVPAEDVQKHGGGDDTVRQTEISGSGNGGTDAGSDGAGTVRERGEGVYQRDDVRPEAGEVTEEAAAEETEAKPEAETPEEIQEKETEEKTDETVEETETRLEAETPRGTNYTIGESLNLPSGEKARYKANTEAIHLLKKLEAEGRYATPEEQEILSKYVGWGGLSQAFDEKNEKWKREYAELAELLTPEEYSAARASTTNAHYTSIEVIRAMYEGLRHLGFQGGRMLEPSGGIGHFIGAMPADMQQAVRSWTMVELDSITGRIAQKLYPNADVRVEGFENAKIGNNVMDVAIGNVPFGNFPIVDDAYHNTVTSAIHNYFFAKAIDKVRPGGVLMFITSHYTMDAQNTSVREYMQQQADLLGAVRLPYTAFKGNAGTEVVTDILIFKKREAGTPYRGERFSLSSFQPMGNTWTNVNEYFVRHPEMVMGTMEMTGTMYRGGELTVQPKGKDLGKQIVNAIGSIEGRMDYSAKQPSVEELQQRAEKAQKNTKENGYEVKGGKVYQNKNGQLEEVKKTKTVKGKEVEETLTEDDVQRITDMLAIRDTARELQNMQKQGADPKEIAEQRKKLNKQYDAFSKKYERTVKSGKNKGKVIPGMLHSSENAKLIEKDPDHYFILALENWDKKTKTATKADIFSKDTIAPVVTVTHADTAQDAIAVVLNEKAYIDIARVAELLGVTKEEAEAAMLDGGLAFLNENGTLETREKYLSGDVRAKLRKAEALATLDSRYQRNVDELKKVIPEDIGRDNIYVKPGATWIPDAVYEQFICEMIKRYNYRYGKKNVTVKYVPQSGTYALELSTEAKKSYQNKEEWGTTDRTFEEIFDAMMNNRTITVHKKDMFDHQYVDEAATLAVKEKTEKIQKRFTEWIWENEERAKSLEKLYNDQYNAIVVPEYDGSGLTIAGANANKQLRPHQKNVVHRIIQNGGNTLIAHCVGAGKTAEMAGAAMKLRQLGIVQKPVFVVPKALVAQWGREFLDFFPAAKILVLNENDFNEKNRKEFSNRIATGDYDAIIMSREQFGKLPMTPEYQKKFYNDLIDEIVIAMQEAKESSGKKGDSIKELEKTKKRLQKKLHDLEIKLKDDAGINFEDMGIDSIFVDEAHEYKNLMFLSNMNRISGLGNRDGSQRAFDMYMKTRYLRTVNGGRGIVFATATPVMNSMSEMYIMQKYLQEDKLNQLGIRSFDAWANLFGEVMTVIEPTPSGKGFRQKEAFARFKNLPELQRLFRYFADVKTKIEGLKIPKMKGGKRITVECEPGQFQLDYIDKLAERAERMRHGHVDPKEDNMLKITSEGRKLSYTQRMIDPSLPYEDGCKLLKCVDNVEQIWKESKENRGTQLIFCDMATPKGKADTDTDSDTEEDEDQENVNFYADIKRMLVGRGIPAEEIAFIHDANTNERKAQLFEDVNEGRVRVLIGSTGKMGVGMNAQKRMVALHHMDAPWRPGDIEQREGRVLRQGNMNDEVGIYVYITKKTFDTRMWDNLYRKATFINQIMNGTNTAREVEGDGDFALSAAEIKAIATGDPMIMEQFEVANKIKQIESLESEWNKEKRRARDRIAYNNARIASTEAMLPKMEEDVKTAAAVMGGDFMMRVDGKRYTERAKAAAPLMEAVKKHEGILTEKKIGEIGGFTLYADGKGDIVIKGAGTYDVQVNFESETGTMTRLMNRIEKMQENLDARKAEMQRMRKENESSEQRMNEPFEKAAELEELRARAEEIANILNPVEDQAGAAALEDKGETDEAAPEEKIRHSRREALEEDMEASDGTETFYGDRIRFSRRVTDKQELDFLENQKHITTYKTMQIIDGKLYPPMAAVVAGNKEDYSVLGEWEKATEHPELIKEGNKFTLNKGQGKGSLAAAYNPYMHSSNLMLNDQFTGAYDRPNLVTVECEVPESEATSGYHAEYAKDSTGWHSWHTGPVASQLRKEKNEERQVFLSRWIKPVRIVPDNEVARHYAKLLRGTNIQVPDNVVSPSLLAALKKEGVPVKESGKVKLSARDPEDLSNRQLLARAYEGILANEKDRKYLEKYKEVIAKLDADTEEVRRLKREYHDKTFVRGQVDKEGAAKARAKYLALEEKITKADETLLRLERSEPLKKALEFEKKEAKRKAEEKAANTVKNYYEGVNRREYAIRIKKTAERLGQWLNQPDAKRHVPKAAQQAVADFLLTITQSRMAEFKGKGGTRRERNFVESMRRLKDFVDDVSAYKLATAEERVEEDYKEFIDLPNGFKEKLAALIESVEKTIGTAGRENVIDKMTSDQMKELYQVMCTISTSITKINDFLTESAFKHVDEAAQNTMNFIRKQGRVEYLGSGRAHNFMNWENTQPIRAFERFGGGGMAVWDGLRRGQAQLAFNLQEIIKETDPANGYATPQEIKKWRETVKVFRMGDRLVPMTAAQAIDVYNLIKRGQAVGHIFGEGIRIADFKTQKGKLIRDKGGKITPEEAAAIAAYVESTPRMKQVADKMQKFVAQYGKRKGNPVNMKRFGYEFMNEENYWPIESDRDFLQAKTDNSKGNELYRLLNISSVKPLTEGARNRIMVRDAFDVFTQNLIDMAQYGALALPVLDAVKWVNFREKWEEEREDGRRVKVYGEGIHSTARDQYGNQAYRYLIELLKDIQGVQATGDWGEDFSRKMLQRYNRAAIAANLSVAAKQPMSITRAAMELGSIDLITGALKNIGQYKQNLGTMLKYSGIAVWKIEMGFYDVNVSRSAKRLILRDDSAMDKALNATTALNEKADTVTWAAIWGACESWVRKQGGSYDSTDAFYKAVAEKFDDVIYKTQVVDSILTRSQFMRGTSFMNKWFSSFMSEPTTSYNMVLDAWWKFRNDMRRGLSFGQAFAENRTRILRTTAVYMVSAAVMTLLEALIGAYRDDDDYETFAEKFNAGLLNNAMDEFNVLNNLPIVRDAMDFVKKFLADHVLPDEWNVYATEGGNNPVFSGVETLMGAADVWDKILSENSNYTVYGAVYKTASALSQISGVPVAPAMREVVALWNNVMAYQMPQMRIETYESTASQGAAALYRAIQAGDEDRERIVRGQLAANNVDDKELKTAINTLLKKKMKEGRITEEEAKSALQTINGLGANDAYYKVQEWEYELAHKGEDYSRFDKLTEAITKGTGIDEAVKELTSHGYTKKDAQGKVRSIISEQAGKTKTMPVTRAVTLLEKYGGMTANEAWIRGQELNYQRLTGDATTADSAMVIYAIEQKKSPKEAIDGLLAHGKKKEDIASAITNKYKQTYLELRTTNVSKAATLKGQLISIYEYLGYDGKKKVEDWEKKAK